MRAESKIEILLGDFRAGVATIDDVAISLRRWNGEPDLVPLGAISAVTAVGAQKSAGSVGKRLSGATKGGIAGGAIGAVFSGGIATPVGAVVGAALGAIGNGKGVPLVNCHVQLRDGRHFVAAGQQATWAELEIMVRMAQVARPVPPMLTIDMLQEPAPSPEKPRRMPRLPFRRKD
jgi:outer membrane lipoprotein SlyB